MRLFAWVAVNVVLAVALFSGSAQFPHFWQEWECLAATSACVYNLLFVVFSFAQGAPEGGEPLADTLKDNSAKSSYLLFRVGLSSGFFFLAILTLWNDRMPTPSDAHIRHIVLKLFFTGLAFTTLWLGDLLTAQALRRQHASGRRESPWISHFWRHAWLIDFPLVVGYAGLCFIFVLYHRNPPQGLPTGVTEMAVQAFVGGASAMEMLILSAIHGLSEFAEHGPDSHPLFRRDV